MGEYEKCERLKPLEPELNTQTGRLKNTLEPQPQSRDGLQTVVHLNGTCSGSQC